MIPRSGHPIFGKDHAPSTSQSGMTRGRPALKAGYPAPWAVRTWAPTWARVWPRDWQPGYLPWAIRGRRLWLAAAEPTLRVLPVRVARASAAPAPVHQHILP